MKSWQFFTVSAFALLIILSLLKNEATEVEWKSNEDWLTKGLRNSLLGKLEKGSRVLLRERIVYEAQLTIETDYIVDSGNILNDDDSQTSGQQEIAPSRTLSYSDESPGICLRTTRKAFDYWIPIALKYAKTAAVRVVHIPPITKKKFDCRVTVYNLRVSDVAISLASYQIAAPNLLTLSLTNGRMVLDGEYKVKVEFPPAKKHGSITVTLSNVAVAFTVGLSKNSQGILQAQIHQCTSSIGSIAIRVGNEIVKRLFNIYKGDFKSEAKRQICPSLGQLIGTANNMLVKQTSLYNLPGGLKFDYGLIKNPEARDSFLDFELKGVTETVEADQTHDISFLSGLSSPITAAPKRMVVAYISDLVFNSFLFNATKAGLFNEIHLEKVDETIKRLLRLSCADGEQCIGKFSPNMSKTFVDSTGKLILKVATSPTVIISQNGAILTLQLKFELRYQQRTFQFLLDSAAPILILSFDLNATVNVTSTTIRKASPTQNNVTAIAHITSISTFNIEPRVEEIKIFARGLPIAIKLLAQKSLNQVLSKGIVFSPSRNVNFDMDVAFQDRALVLDTDVMKV